MILVIDNTKNLRAAYMTPKLLFCLEKKNVSFVVASTRSQVNTLIEEHFPQINGIILSGGPLCLSEELTISLINKNFAVLLRLASKVPILGICFGFQLLVASYGGKIVSMENESRGVKTLHILSRSSPLFKGIHEDAILVFQSHKDCVAEVPPNFEVIAVDEKGTIQAVENRGHKIWGLQFHPEGLETTVLLINNFLEICSPPTSSLSTKLTK